MAFGLTSLHNQHSIEPLRDFVRLATRCVEKTNDEAQLIAQLKPLLKGLIDDDRWLPPAFAQPHPQYYQQYLLHCDPLERFSVVSFVWGIGQQTPIHDHGIWGLVGILRGAELCQSYAPDAGGFMQTVGKAYRLERGDIEAVSPSLGDMHTVANAMTDQPSISIHVYGANIGAFKRHVYRLADPSTSDPEALRKDFISGYSASTIPNLWDRSRS